MRGRKPKERECYILRMGDGTLVEVTREVYLEWYRSRRREKYQRERNQKNKVCSLDEMEESGCFTVPVKDSLEETAIRNLCREKVRQVLEELPAEDAQLIYLLFFKEMSVKEAARLYGCSRRTIQNRRNRILETLRINMGEAGIQGGCF